ncbi:hypothetical protein GGR56DRAFT_154961 [Xylariaceae sp. FL0804]|nr:hypothetical protein GGR56DRAFT_154961 [Xylariaceae sp. FL0804]
MGEGYKHSSNRPLLLYGLLNALIALCTKGVPSRIARIASCWSEGALGKASLSTPIRGRFFRDPITVEAEPHISPGMCPAYPCSRSYIHTLGPGVDNALDFDTANFSDAGDIDVEYDAADDAVIVRFLRENINTTLNSLGTARMAPLAEMGVADARLYFHGVRRLKLADLSIYPSHVAASTNSMTLTVGEKAADIIIKQLGWAFCNTGSWA